MDYKEISFSIYKFVPATLYGGTGIVNILHEFSNLVV